MNIKKHPIVILLLAIMMMAFVQRTPLVAFGPIVSTVSQELALSGTMSGVIAAVPLLTFALFSPLAARWANRWGMERVLIGSIVVLIMGLVVRIALPSVVLLLLGTLIISAAIAMSNVLLPALAKRDLPTRVGLVIGVISITMSISSALAAAVAMPLANQFGWQWSLGVWIVPAMAALCMWLVWQQKFQAHFAQPASLSTPKHANPNPSSLHVWRLPAAWTMSIFMGVQSLGFYSITNFLPAMLIEKGATAVQAGLYASVFQAASLISIVISLFIFPKSSHKQGWTMLLTSLILLGMIGIWQLPLSQTLFWVLLLGTGISGTFSIIMMLFALRTDSTQEAAALSGMAQAVGYLIACLGPLGIGFLHDWFGTWNASLGILTMLMAIETALAWFASSPKTLRQTMQ